MTRRRRLLEEMRDDSHGWSWLDAEYLLQEWGFKPHEDLDDTRPDGAYLWEHPDVPGVIFDVPRWEPLASGVIRALVRYVDIVRERLGIED